LGKHVSRQWSKLFDKDLSSKAAESLAKHYINLHGKKKGGSAPVDYVMRPGLPAVATYATFPTEVGADPKSVQDLDVYYNNALGRSCNIGTVQAKVPADMGSNQVPVPVKGGGFSTTYSTNQQIMVTKGGKRKTKQSVKRTTRRNTRRNKVGGDLATAITTRPYIASNPSGIIQRGTEAWYGQPVHPSDVSDPSSHGWSSMSNPYIGPAPDVPSSITTQGTLATTGLPMAVYTPPANGWE
jgi:hypothetical protein